MPPVRLAVPEKTFGLALILGFFDRCGKSKPPSSAAGSGGLLFPVRGEGKGVRDLMRPYGGDGRGT